MKKFYCSNFWKNRYYRRIKEEHLVDLYSRIKLCTLDLLKEVSIIKVNSTGDGRAYNKTIEINTNVDKWKLDSEYEDNTLIHEFGHILYMLDLFLLVVLLNDLIIKSPSPTLLETDSYYKYISDSNEIRLRIIPLVKCMYENNWSAEEVYGKTCKYDDIFNFYSKELIIYWINNIL